MSSNWQMKSKSLTTDMHHFHDGHHKSCKGGLISDLRDKKPKTYICVRLRHEIVLSLFCSNIRSHSRHWGCVYQQIMLTRIHPPSWRSIVAYDLRRTGAPII